MSATTGFILIFIMVVAIIVYFYGVVGGNWFAEPKTIKVCNEWKTQQYIQRAPSIGIPIGDGGAPSLMLPMGNDIIKEREVCSGYKEIPNPNYVEIENGK